MGCVSSKRDINDRHPNVFHVWNVDELGNMLVPGQIEITDSELVLYQKGKEAIRWPMRCLRRYGFDAELFSFESGRRCATGPGIYAFKCGRAEALFNLLQEHIQNSGQDDTSHAGHTIGTHTNASTVVVMASTAPGSNGSSLRSGSVSVSDVGNYLEPIIRHRTRSNASRDGFSRMATQSLPSNLAFSDSNQSGVVATSIPNGANINASPHYVNGDLNSLTGCERDRGSGSLSTRSPLTPPANFTSLHEYANTALVTNEGENSPVSVKSTVPDQNAAQLPGAQEIASSGSAAEASASDNKLLYSILDFHKNIVGVMKGSNGCRQVVLRGHSLDDNTNYAKLDDLLKQEHSAQQHLYMNVVPDGAQKKKDNCSNFMSSKGYSYRDHFYANVGPLQTSVESTSSTGAPLSCLTKENNARQSHHNHSQSLPSHAVSRQVNYAILDLNHRGSNSSGGSASIAPSNGVGGSETAPTSPTSITTPPELTDNCALEGYATIDFKKTAALSNSANPRLDDDESLRVTRHDRNIIDPHHNKHSSIIGE